MSEKLIQLDFLREPKYGCVPFEQRFSCAMKETQDFQDEARRSIRGLFARYNDLYNTIERQQKIIDRLMFKEIEKEPTDLAL